MRRSRRPGENTRRSAGAGHVQLSASVAAALAEAGGRVKLLPVFSTVAAQLRVSELRRAAEFRARPARCSAKSATTRRRSPARFGLPTDAVTLRRAGELAELGTLAAVSTRPEPDWLNPALIGGVERAAQALEPICSGLAQQQERLGGVFTDEVLTLDLESLRQRFETVHRGFGKLGSRLPHRQERARRHDPRRQGDQERPRAPARRD